MSMLEGLSNILERLICNKIYKLSEKHNVIHKTQYVIHKTQYGF